MAHFAGALLGVDLSRVVRVEQLGDELGIARSHPAALERRNPFGARQLARHDLAARELRERRRDVECRVAPRALEMDDARRGRFEGASVSSSAATIPTSGAETVGKRLVSGW